MPSDLSEVGKPDATEVKVNMARGRWKFPTELPPPGASSQDIGKFFDSIRVAGWNTMMTDPYMHLVPAQCGQTALAFLTGNSMLAVTQKLKDKELSDEQMLTYLTERGFKYIALKGSFVQTSDEHSTQHIKRHHVVLQKRFALIDENTWVVKYGNRVYHLMHPDSRYNNRQAEDNFPVLSSYVIWHPARGWIRAKPEKHFVDIIGEAEMSAGDDEEEVQMWDD